MFYAITRYDACNMRVCFLESLNHQWLLREPRTEAQESPSFIPVFMRSCEAPMCFTCASTDARFPARKAGEKVHFVMGRPHFDYDMILSDLTGRICQMSKLLFVRSCLGGPSTRRTYDCGMSHDLRSNVQTPNSEGIASSMTSYLQGTSAGKHV